MKLNWQKARIQVRTSVILDELNIQIDNGESLGIIGANATGKTSLAKAVAGLLPVYDIPDCKNTHTVFVSFQSDFQLKHGAKSYRQQRWNMFDTELVPTVREVFASVQHQDKLKKLIHEFKFENHLDRFVISLSNGEQRKLELIKAMAEEPELLVLDNAYNGLDAASRILLSDMLNTMVQNGRQLVLTGLKAEDFPSEIKRFVFVDGHSANMVDRPDLELNYDVLGKQNLQIPHWENSGYGEIVALKNVSLKYNGATILSNVSWTVMAGEEWVLSGANGSGKTSLLNLIFGDNPRAYGCDIRLFGKQKGSGESIWEIKDRVGFVSPEMHQYLPSGQSVNDVLCSGFYGSEGLYNKPSTYQRIMAKKWLQLIDLGYLSEVSFKSLASSHQRMILVLRALIKNPPFLILDEPFQGLDPTNISILRNLLDNIGEQTNCAMIFVSHFKDVVPATFKRSLVLNKGVVEYCE